MRYFKEYYVENKFIGTTNCELEGREIGYFGRKKEVLKDLLITDNKKKIKPNTEVLTIIYPLDVK